MPLSIGFIAFINWECNCLGLKANKRYILIKIKRSFRNYFTPLCPSQLLVTERFRESVWKCIFSRKKCLHQLHSHTISIKQIRPKTLCTYMKLRTKRYFFSYCQTLPFNQEPFKNQFISSFPCRDKLKTDPKWMLLLHHYWYWESSIAFTVQRHLYLCNICKIIFFFSFFFSQSKRSL